MARRIGLLRPVAGLVLAVSGLALGACQKGAQNAATQPVTATPAAALPLATAAPPPVAAAPPASALPPSSRPVGYAPRAPRERYRYINDAYAMGDAFGDAPPDYAVDYDGTRPWVWRSDNGAYRVVERLPQGERDYYYEPGADQPYFISDPDYGYAYDHGVLVAAYDARGAALSDRIARERADDAARYWTRARALHRAALNQPRQSAYAADWRERAPDFQRQRRQWAEQAHEDADWRDWHDSHADEEQRQWGRERDQREAYTAALGAAVAGATVALSGHDHGESNKTVVATKTAQTAPPATQLATVTKPKPTGSTNQPAPTPQVVTTTPPRHLAATTAPLAKAWPPAKLAETPKNVVVQKTPAPTGPVEMKKTVVVQKAPRQVKPADTPKTVVVQTKTETPPRLPNIASPEKPPHPAAAPLAAHEHRGPPAAMAASHASSVTTTTVVTEHPKHETAAAAPPPAARQKAPSLDIAEKGHRQLALVHAATAKPAPGQQAGKHPPEGADKEKHKPKNDENN